jgi:UDP-N-acetylglucosamine 2-epimerase (non-hydrolysing)
LRLNPPDYNLGVGSGTHGFETGRIMEGVERILMKNRPSVALIEGDTNTVLGGALAASKLGICLGHVESGLRSYDRSMPEELNRVVADHVSDFLFPPTEGARRNLMNEGLGSRDITVTGNTIVDALEQCIPSAKETDVNSYLVGVPGEYALTTIHRQENVENPSRFSSIIRGLELVSQELKVPVIYPIHPRAKRAFEEFGLSVDSERVRIMPPADYFRFLKLEMGASLILTDSGGVQEESCVLGVRCVTLRHNTERPETLEVGANMLGGTEPNSILTAAQTMMAKSRSWQNPFGDAHAAERIVNFLMKADQ